MKFVVLFRIAHFGTLINVIEVVKILITLR